MRLISSRQIKSYVGNAYHEDVPIPSNWLTPENSNPDKYDGVPDSAPCPACKKLVGNPDNVDNKGNANFTCPGCNSRFSRQVRDKGMSPMATTPQTLDVMMGGNTNNAAGGVEYHPGANSNIDTFSSNLGQAALKERIRRANILDKIKSKKNKPKKNKPEPKIYSSVLVHEPSNPDDEWSQSFDGMIVEINKDETPTVYHVQDQEENVFLMERDQFDYPAEENSIAVGDRVSVHSPVAGDSWDDSFNGQISQLETDELVGTTYYVFDEYSGDHYLMSRDKFDVVR